jgi:hypothetical protein
MPTKMTDRVAIEIDFSNAGNSREYVCEGWSKPEPLGTWSVGDQSRLVLPLFEVSGKCTLQIAAISFRPPGMDAAQRLSIHVNNELILERTVSGGIDAECEIPAAALTNDESVEIRLSHPDAVAPTSLGLSTDSRRLGFLVQRLALHSEAAAVSTAGPAAAELFSPARINVRQRDFLVVCAIVKNEAQYIYEWLSYHHFLGVERFYIYNNNSSDETLDVIRSWPHAHLVQVINWPHVGGQHGAYRHMVREYGDAAEWCAFIDGDEFLCPQTEVGLPGVLEAFSSDCSGLYAHWLMFGSSGLTNRIPGLVTETFVHRGWNSFGPNALGKSIVKLKQAIGPLGAHVMQLAGRLINDTGAEISQTDELACVTPSHKTLAINHYFTKSLEEWSTRRNLGKATHLPQDPQFRRSRQEFDQHDVNDVVDRRALHLMSRCKPFYY